MRFSDWTADVCSSDLAGTAQLQILLGDAGAVVGLAHDAQARAGGLAERPLPQQQAGGLAAAAADAAAELVKLGEAEAPGVLAHHDEIGRASCRDRVCQYV